MSTLGVAFEDHPELVRSVSLGPCNTSQPVPLKAHLYTLCVHGCTQAHVTDLLLYILYYDIIGQCVSVCMCWSSVYCTVSFDWLSMPLYISFSPCAVSHCRGFVGLTCWPSARVSGALSSTLTKVPNFSLHSTTGWRECVTVHPLTTCLSAVWTQVSGVRH